MSKTIFVLLCLLAISLSLKMHDEGPVPSTNSGQPTPSNQSISTELSFSNSTAQQMSTPEAQQAFQRLAEFQKNDKGIFKALSTGKKLTQSQNVKLTKWMAQDPFFQNTLIQAVASQKGNQWMKKLSKPAQIKTVKTIASYSPSQLKKPSTFKKIIAQLKADPQIGPALNNVDANGMSVSGVALPTHQVIQHYYQIAENLK